MIVNFDLEIFDWIKWVFDDWIGYLMCNECVDEVWIIVVVKNEMLVVFDE